MKCPYRYIDKGRTFCSLAILESKYNLSEVTPDICATCKIPALVQRVPCRHLDLGVSILGFYAGAKLEQYFAACRLSGERLPSLDSCSRDCPGFEPAPGLLTFFEAPVDPAPASPAGETDET